VQRYDVTIGASATPADTYDFKIYDQNGNVLAAYTPAGGARITVGNTTLSTPTAFHRVGPASGNIATLIWAPVQDTDFAGYRVYQGTTSGVYNSQPICNITPASAAATFSSQTMCSTVIPVA
jgi:hypothetical protein